MDPRAARVGTTAQFGGTPMNVARRVRRRNGARPRWPSRTPSNSAKPTGTRARMPGATSASRRAPRWRRWSSTRMSAGVLIGVTTMPRRCASSAASSVVMVPQEGAEDGEDLVSAHDPRHHLVESRISQLRRLTHPFEEGPPLPGRHQDHLDVAIDRRHRRVHLHAAADPATRRRSTRWRSTRCRPG